MTRLTKSLVDVDGDQAILVGYESGIYIGVRIQGEEERCAGPFTIEALRAALEEVAPAVT